MNLGSPTAVPRRWAILIIVPASALFVALVALVASSNRPDSGGAASRAPAAGGAPTLGDGTWVATADGDFEERIIDSSGSRLRLRAATRHTRNDTLKFLGVRRREGLFLAEGTRVTADLDWNNQANGSGLSASIVLAPVATSGNPFELSSCLWIEYIGVPPGKNARMVIGVREGGHHRHLYNEGWPDTHRAGRKIGLQRLQVVFGKDRAFRVLENGREIYASGPNAISFDRAHLYLQMSSRSNYPPREIFFDNVSVEAGR